MAAYVKRQTRNARARRSLNHQLRKINRAGGQRAQQIAEYIVDRIREYAPYDDRAGEDTTGGHLKDSYRVVPHPVNPGQWLIATDRRYWVFVEFGTKEHGRAQPHVRPAVEDARMRYQW